MEENKHQDIYTKPIFEWYKSKKYSSEEYINGVWVYTKSRTAYNYTITKNAAYFEFDYNIIKDKFDFINDQFENEIEYIKSLFFDKITDDFMNSNDQLIKIDEPEITIVNNSARCRANVEYIKDYDV